ncbi:hypothetical protein JQ554_31420 [Bradyrhizobium diazoefficiens]|nr:hypothetical protein [Bradyrhizobium diazoefficiens]MBR0967735.1 hypothetical protein [Bradyrhizobium diazoefficiens]MBR0981129.1 hypothetical protein [Bradyrhizobium diazoefficiens]MBR1005962.1 hypothetical protein [Bradyrhizobium diazoefficiens]MBR1015871.1 hypothetical protein [Bradyrhizobium diazoefficiens]MBR1054421.1 hypothetical protein [Bradyrhizobium diazoefficiens]
MAASPAFISTKTLIVILSLAAIPTVSFAQATGGASGSGGPAGGVANSSAPAPGTNSLGTAQSSGASAGGTGGAAAGGTTDAAVNAENRVLDKKLKSICRGC